MHLSDKPHDLKHNFMTIT